jgi:hypothetical protein
MNWLCKCGCGEETLTLFKHGHNMRGTIRDDNASRNKKLSGPVNPRWKGDEISYSRLHNWVRREKTKTEICEHCGQEGYTEWANVDHLYRRDLDDYMELCKLCHRAYDK